MLNSYLTRTLLVLHFDFQTQVRRDEPEQLVHVTDREVVAEGGDSDSAHVQRPLRDLDRERAATGAHGKTSRTGTAFPTRKSE